MDKGEGERNRQGKVWQVRFNKLSAEARRAILDGSIQPPTYEWKQNVKKLQHLSTSWQGKMLATEKADPERWWPWLYSLRLWALPSCVGVCVIEYNFFQYLRNLRRETQILGSVRPCETFQTGNSREGQRQNLLVTLDLEDQDYKSLLEKDRAEDEEMRGNVPAAKQNTTPVKIPPQLFQLRN